MEEGRKKIWIWLTVMMLTAMLVGGCYYFGTEKETDYGQEGTLVECPRTGEKAADTQAKGISADGFGAGLTARRTGEV